jgi:hypothetical protein
MNRHALRFLQPAALAVSLLTGSAAAQAQSFGPTDNDLFAMYCVGVAATLAEQSRTSIRHADDGAAAAEAMRLRSVRYLFARGYLTNPEMRLEVLRMVPLRTAGAQDVRDCDSKNPLICRKVARCSMPDSLP